MSLQNKGKKPINDYSNFTKNPSFSATPTENYQYGMPSNFFVGQTPPPGVVRPSRAEPVRPVTPTGQTGASAGGPVRPVPWCSVLRHSHSLRLFPLRLALACKKNRQSLYRRILGTQTANLCFLHSCPRMFGMIGLRPIHNMPHKRCPLLILRHIILAKHLPATMRPIFLG